MGPLEKKIDRLEKQVRDLRLKVVTNSRPGVRVSLRGALKGVKISDKDIAEAKASLFPRRKLTE